MSIQSKYDFVAYDDLFFFKFDLVCILNFNMYVHISNQFEQIMRIEKSEEIYILSIFSFLI